MDNNLAQFSHRMGRCGDPAVSEVNIYTWLWAIKIFRCLTWHKHSMAFKWFGPVHVINFNPASVIVDISDEIILYSACSQPRN